MDLFEQAIHDHVKQDLSNTPKIQSMDMILYQGSINDWMHNTFGDKVLFDKKERSHRFAEEAIELLQATGYTKEELQAMIDYVYNRPVGEIRQEVGGTIHCLSALCTAHHIVMSHEALMVMRYCEQNSEKIRQKHSQKPDSIASNKNYGDTNFG
jgi:hypothetical protein